jgi:hypothetical protein
MLFRVASEGMVERIAKSKTAGNGKSADLSRRDGEGYEDKNWVLMAYTTTSANAHLNLFSSGSFHRPLNVHINSQRKKDSTGGRRDNAASGWLERQSGD